MRILALETGGAHATIAAILPADKGVFPARTVPEPKRLACDLMRLIDEAIGEAGWRPADIELVAVGLGPGSWTGLRIGLSTAKTLAQTLGCPLVGVPTFDALARAAWQETVNTHPDIDRHLLLTTMTCRAGELYAQLYECSSDYLVRAQPAWIGAPQRLADTLTVEALSRAIEGGPLLVGSGAPSVGALLAERGEIPGYIEVDGRALCFELAQAALEEGKVSDPLTLQPLYLAPSAAERNLLGTRANNA